VKTLAAIAAACVAPLAVTAAHAGSPRGRIAGVVYLDGGPARAGRRPHPAAGWQVIVMGSNGRTAAAARTRHDGRFTVGVAPGRYLIAGRYPAPPHRSCAARTVVVTAARAAHVRVYCSIR
jgi:hypothetical protein